MTKSKTTLLLRFTKRVLATAIILSLVFSLAVLPTSAYTFGDFEYKNLDDGTVEISGYKGSDTELIIPSEINGKKVTSIGWYAFEDCTTINSVIIPESVTEISFGAFYGCTSLSSISIPDNVTRIYSGAFYKTSWYDNQPNGVVYAGKVAYEYKGIMPENTELKLDDGTLSISDCAFSFCRGLKSIAIPNSVTSIGDCAFDFCENLTDITIPESVTDIGDQTFSGCTGLTSINIPYGVTIIGNYVFEGCTGLTSITLPNSVTSIYNGAFKNCTALSSIQIPDSVTIISSSAFDGTAWYDKQQDGVVYAGKVAYKYKGEMPENTAITLDNGTTGIADDAFSGCTGLKDINIPDSVKYVGYGAFLNCNGLTSVTIPKSVTNIGFGAFGYYTDQDEYQYTKLESFGIFGYDYSEAKTYAKRNGFTFTLLTFPELPEVIYNLNDLPVFKGRTMQEIGQEFSNGIYSGETYVNRDSNTYYTVDPSLSSPYEAGKLTQDTHNAMMGLTNFYRWLVGVEKYKEPSVHSDELQAGALIRNFDFNHYVSRDNKPSDMSDELWNLGAGAKHNIIALGATPQSSVAVWINEGYSLRSNSWNTLGHRYAIISPYNSGIQYGYAGSCAIGKVQYPQSQENYFKDNFYAFPSPGYCPQQIISPGNSAWNIGTKPELLTYINTEDVAVTITNINTGKEFVRTVKDNTVRVSEDSIEFAQPDDYDQNNYRYKDNYKVEVTGLIDAATGRNAVISYEVDFFDVTGYMPSFVSGINNLRTYVVYKSLNDTESLKKLAAILPDEISLSADSGYVFKAKVSGAWELDEENSCWTNSVDESQLPDFITDKNNVLENIKIPYEISDSIYDAYNSLTISPAQPEEGEPGSMSVYRTLTSANRSEIYKITKNSDGTYSGEKRFDNLTSPEFDKDDTSYSHVYNIESFKVEDSGEYVSIYYNDSPYYQEVYVSTAIKGIDISHNYTSRITKKPDHTHTGVRTYTCTVCGDTYDEEIPVLDYIPGDITGDGKITLIDAIEIQQAAVKIITLSENKLKIADLNGDGNITVVDAIITQKMALGIEYKANL